MIAPRPSGFARHRVLRSVRNRRRSLPAGSHIRILLLERLDAVGAAAQDALARVVALRGAGDTVRAIVVGGDRAVADCAPTESATGVVRVVDDAACRAAVRGHYSRSAPDLAIVASAGQAPLEAWLPPGARCAWWPTALLAPEDARMKWGEVPALNPPDPADIIDRAIADSPRGGRTLLPLWDGDYVLLAGPLEGAAGGGALEAFAAVAGEYDAHDFVVLADPQPEFESRARALGIGPRVHFAGPAPREAEHAWLSSASAVLIAGNAPFSAGMLLRALAHRAPVLPIGSDGVPGIVARWLSRNGYAPVPQDVGAGARLEAVLRHPSETSEAIGRGVALATARTPQALNRRVVEALALLGRDAAAA